MPLPKECEDCKEKFEPTGRNAKFCPSCRTKRHIVSKSKKPRKVISNKNDEYLEEIGKIIDMEQLKSEYKIMIITQIIYNWRMKE